MQTTAASAIGAPTNAYFLSFQTGYLDAPLLVYLPGLDETGKDLISLQTASFEEDFNVRALVIPSDDLDDWDLLAAERSPWSKRADSHAQTRACLSVRRVFWRLSGAQSIRKSA